jgi:hypothetical protein
MFKSVYIVQLAEQKDIERKYYESMTAIHTTLTIN